MNKQYLLDLSRKTKICILLSIDFFYAYLVWFIFGTPLSSYLASNFEKDFSSLFFENFITFIIPITLSLIFFLISGFYNSLTRFKPSGDGFWKVFIGALIFGISYITIFLSGQAQIGNNYFLIFLLQTVLISSIFFSGIIFIRELAKYILKSHPSKKDSTPIVIYGAGSVGTDLAKTLQYDDSKRIVAFFDDDSSLHGISKLGIPIFSSKKKLSKLKKDLPNLEIYLAIPSLQSSARRKIIEGLEELNISIKSVPAYHELISNSEDLYKLQRLSLEDILPSGRIDSDFFETIHNKNILVTGAGGSIGSELVRQLLDNKPKSIILYEISEFNLYKIYQECILTNSDKNLNTKIKFLLGDIKSPVQLENTFKNNDIDFVFHAAAYKHVPIVEDKDNICMAVENNIIGTFNLAQVANKFKVKNFVLISTDKAVRPKNIMGATKRMAELICQAFAQISNETIFSMVRFGNVIDSSGSVIPLFKDQISRGGPITITHRDITRYFMTIPEAASLVINAAVNASGGEVFLLDMGEQIKVIDLAKRMVRLSGRNVSKQSGDGGIEIVEIGLRPGEKMYEELLISGTEERTSHKKIYKSVEESLNFEEINEIIDKIRLFLSESDDANIINIFREYVSGYN